MGLREGASRLHRDQCAAPLQAPPPCLRVHSRPALPGPDITRHRNIPLIQPVRTFLDLATVTGPKGLERAINEADKLDVIDADSLRGALEEHGGEPGIRALPRILDQHTFRFSDDELERLFRPLAATAGLPAPKTKEMLDGFEADFFWPELGLVVETDGWRYHRTPATQRTCAADLHPYPPSEAQVGRARDAPKQMNRRPWKSRRYHPRLHGRPLPPPL